MALTSIDIVTLLKNNDKAVGRALVVLKDRQTADEQVTKTTKHHNGRGFRPCHARMGTSMAKFYEARGYLTAKQLAYWRVEGKEGMRIAIYHRQLMEEAKIKAAKNAELAAAKTKDVIEDWVEDIKWKNEFGRLEALAEQRAYAREMQMEIELGQ